MASSLALLAAAAAAALPALPAPPAERGLALGLFASDPAYDYAELIGEIASTGATHLSLAWVWWQEDLRASEIEAVGGWTPSDAQITRAIAVARAHGLHVTLFPILRLVTAKPDEWRGKIAPANEDRWWRSYEELVQHAAALAGEHGAQRLSIGSELVTREKMRGRWIDLIDRLRIAEPDLELMYSANWDHFEPVGFWDLVDVVGITAYFELTKAPSPAVEDLVAAWAPVRRTVESWSRKIGRKIVIAEIGYPSLETAAAWPWDETRKARIDHDLQRRAYEAAIRVWSGSPAIDGLYWWNWFGFGGERDAGYSPRNKPAGELLESWYRGRR